MGELNRQEARLTLCQTQLHALAQQVASSNSKVVPAQYSTVQYSPVTRLTLCQTQLHALAQQVDQ
eukprot:2151991-Pyramimonas_sp.AAC.1